MKFCPHCGKKLPERSGTCPSCGKKPGGASAFTVMPVKFWMILAGVLCSVAFSVFDWVKLSLPSVNVGFSLFSVWGKFGDIEGLFGSAGEFAAVKAVAIALAALLLASYVLTALSLIRCRLKRSAVLACVGFGLSAFVSVVFICIMMYYNTELGVSVFSGITVFPLLAVVTSLISVVFTVKNQAGESHGKDDKTERVAGAVPYDEKIKRSTIITVLCDIVLILALAGCLILYNSRNNTNTYNQNIENLTNIATAKAGLMRVALNNASYEVKSAYRYCNGKTADEILEYLSAISSNGDEYQLLRYNEEESGPSDYVYEGYSTKITDGDYTYVKYENTSLAESIQSHSELDGGKISFSQSFTNKTDALRYFAVFSGIRVETDEGEQVWYIVKPQNESVLLDQLYMYSQYTNLDTAICYADGKYLARDNSFRADNFYDFLYKYNDLSLDEKNAVRTEVQNDPDGKGLLTYKDIKKRDCVFVYSACIDSEGWYVIVSVPISEFVSGRLLSFFPMLIIIFLAILLVFNISRLWAIVKELRLSVEREVIANKSKSSFLSRMSHEIRTPLNAIIGYNIIARNEITDAEEKDDRSDVGERVTDCLMKSEIASKHLLTIINDVLDMSAIESGKIRVSHERFDFRGLVTSLTTVFYSQAKTKGVDFEVIFDTLTEEWFIGDQIRTNQILTNLLSNAIKFTPGDGKVTLKICQPESAENAAHIRFEVIDSGIGMTQEYLSHIWVPFEQADSSISRRFGGTGLGLSITKNLVDLMGGNIAVESTPGKGTKFTVDLTFERTEQPENLYIYDFSSVNALVVDDEKTTCEYIRMLFNRCGAKCVTVTSGADAVNAVRLAAAEGKEYSMCLIDWRMPGMNGLETTEKIREISKKMPIIVITAYDFSEISDKAVKAGVSRFLAKPLFQSALFDLLTELSGTRAVKTVEQRNNINFFGSRIILAEDNTMNMEIAKRIMESSGLCVDCACNGKEAVSLFKASEPGYYSVIMMDIHMPEMNGHDATRAIRSSDNADAKTIPIIAMTADAFTENIEEARNAGMNGLISKPIDINVLFQTLQKYIKE